LRLTLVELIFVPGFGLTTISTRPQMAIDIVTPPSQVTKRNRALVLLYTLLTSLSQQKFESGCA